MKAHDKAGTFYHEYEELEHEGDDSFPATWTTCMGQLPAVPLSSNATTVELYDKMLSDYISDELLTKAKSNTKVRASEGSSSETGSCSE